ncbi:hypothetical protein NLU13_0094 [Sarocladium strictum]|uniref:BZIP domain-containing protein n=1 Tax=Sarocladium strictum TaxID=5046 RepID=A0AA39LB43_SARSR|nr:hypothetical protein NLU13_0094 [Sarocladium strictum]
MQQTTQASPLVQFDDSPADSFISTPGDNYPSLFSTTNATMDPTDMLTPRSSDERLQTPCEQDIKTEEKSEASTPGSSEKKTKKRKSWGQVLPEPKTNLPPRKRAKTEDEKEQRRVERVLRNRRAAQSSRERKRLEVEALEKRNEELEAMLRDAQKANLLMYQQLQSLRQDSGLATAANPLLDSARDTIALSQELFSSQDGYKNKTGLSNELMLPGSPNATVNPASLSPGLTPVPDTSNTKPAVESESSSEAPSTTFPDVTQHPAEMLSDLPCHMSAEVMSSAPQKVSQTSTQPLLAWLLYFQTIFSSASAILSVCQRPLMQIAMSSKAGFSLRPTPQLLTTIIWLVTLPPASSTSTTSSQTKQALPLQNLWQRATTAPLQTTGSASRSTTLRLKSLRKILSSSPNLARPLSDATMVALRLVSEGRDDRVEASLGGPSATRGEVDRELTDCLSSIALPSREVLLTLLWSIRVEERRQQQRQMRLDVALVPEKSVLQDKRRITNQRYILRVKNAARLGSRKQRTVSRGGRSATFRY